MSEWWTYRLSDFLLFSPRTWHRLFELYHAWLWPAQPLVLLLGAGLLFALWRGATWAPRACGLALAIAGQLAVSTGEWRPPAPHRVKSLTYFGSGGAA